jgi:hypothetical protein
MTGGPDVPGRVEITARALGSCARAVAAERLGAPSKRVRVTLGDDQGDLGLEITSPIADGDGLMAGAARAAQDIRARVSDLTGRRVGAARIELTGIVREPDVRVR